MKRDSRLSLTLHAVLHMAHAGQALTSEELARLLKTNSVVVRRTMAGLREAKLVRSTKGHGGGWELARPLAKTSLGDVHDALAPQSLFAIAPRTESPGCLVEQAVNRAMNAAFAEAEAVLLARFRAVSLADIAADVRRNLSPRPSPRHATLHEHRPRKHRSHA